MANMDDMPGAPLAAENQQADVPVSSSDREQVLQWIIELANPATRRNAVSELSKMRGIVPDFGPMLWHSFGTMAALLQEITSIYPVMRTKHLRSRHTIHVCEAVSLLQAVAAHPEIRPAFVKARIPLYLCPFLSVRETTASQYLCLISLGFLGGVVTTDDQEVIDLMLEEEIILLCCHIMDVGSKRIITAATLIMQKIMLNDKGLSYICQTIVGLSNVFMALRNVVLVATKEHWTNLIEHVVRCYLRLSENHRARDELRKHLPDQLKHNTFASCFKGKKNATTRYWIAKLLKNLEIDPVPYQRDPGGDVPLLEEN